MWVRKNGEREPVRHELEDAGIVYKPFVFTTFGRPHPAASEVIKAISQRGARRQGWSKSGLERKFRACIGTMLARRMARMSLATWAIGDDIEVHLAEPFPDEICTH